MFDDQRGVAEPLNETMCGCRLCECEGLIVRGSHHGLITVCCSLGRLVQRSPALRCAGSRTARCSCAWAEPPVLHPAALPMTPPGHINAHRGRAERPPCSAEPVRAPAQKSGDAQAHREVQLRVNNPLVLAFHNVTWPARQQAPVRLPRLVNDEGLPRNVHLLTAALLPRDRILLRLAHLYAVSHLPLVLRMGRMSQGAGHALA